MKWFVVTIGLIVPVVVIGIRWLGEHQPEVNWPVIATISAAIFGVGAKWVLDIKVARQKNAFELHKELHSKDMIEARTKAWIFVRANPDLSLRSLAGKDQDSMPLWQVMQFFHRVSACHEKYYIDRDLTFMLFGELVIWWHEVVIKNRVHDSSWQSIQAIDQLKESLRKFSNTNPKLTAIWDKWIMEAQKDALSSFGEKRDVRP
jgi:hypothetical protein